MINAKCYSQNGTYNCYLQGYKTVDNTVDKTYSDRLIITIDINAAIGGYININSITSGFNFRFDVLSKSNTITDKEKRTITTTYKAKMSQLNIQVGDELLLGIVESMDNNDLSFWSYSEKYKAINQYINLTKFQ